jgi:transcriptional regulator with XRE-family HTH domain
MRVREGGKRHGSSGADLLSHVRLPSDVCCSDLTRLVTYKFLMLGDTIKEARIRKGLTQARLAKMAGVSRRHLAALEKGANVSVSILQRVATVLELAEIQLGGLALRSSDIPKVNVPLLTDAIREARADAERANAILARAEGILGGGTAEMAQVAMSFPRMPIRHLELPAVPGTDLLRERPDLFEVETAGVLRQGQPVDESAKEKVTLPRNLLDNEEIVFRFRGPGADDQNIGDGDLLIVENRPRGRASNGELVLGRIGKQVWIGRWWQKHGERGLMSNGMSEVTVGRGARTLKVVAAVNQIIRGL